MLWWLGRNGISTRFTWTKDVFWFLFFLVLTTEGKIIIVVLSTVLCWNELGRIWLAKVWSIFWFLLIGYDVDTILLSHIWAMAVLGGCRWVDVGREEDLLFDEKWQFLVVLLWCVWCVWIAVTIFVLFIFFI